MDAIFQCCRRLGVDNLSVIADIRYILIRYKESTVSDLMSGLSVSYFEIALFIEGFPIQRRLLVHFNDLTISVEYYTSHCVTWRSLDDLSVTFSQYFADYASDNQISSWSDPLHFIVTCLIIPNAFKNPCMHFSQVLPSGRHFYLASLSGTFPIRYHFYVVPLLKHKHSFYQYFSLH